MTNTNTNDSGRFLEPPQTSLDYLILFAIGSVFIGLIISTIGYIIPRSHTPDPSLTARQQEAVDTYYAKLGNDLDICIVVGMAFIGLGGIVTSAVFCKTIICRECDVGDEETYGLTDHPGQVDGEGYGTVEGVSTGRYIHRQVTRWAASRCKLLLHVGICPTISVASVAEYVY